MLSTPSTGVSVTRATPVLKKSSPLVTSGAGAACGELRDGLHAELGHLDRVLLAGGLDHALLDAADAGATAVDGDRRARPRLAGRLESLRSAVGGGLVDRVDDVDVRVLRQQRLHRGTAAVFGAIGGLVADDLVVAAARVGAGLRLVAVLLRRPRRRCPALEEALVAVVVDRDDLVVEQVEHRDHRLLAVELRGGPLADELAGEAVVCRERDVDGVGGSGGVSSAITYRPASRALLIASSTPGPFGVIRIPLSPRAMASSMAVIWVSSSPSSLPAARVRLTPASFAAASRAVLHGDEERVGVGLDDECDADRVRVSRTGGAGTSGEAHGRRGEHEAADDES